MPRIVSNRHKLAESHSKSAGDTIVEVLIAMTILALALATAFISTSRSLQNGNLANQRQSATAVGSQQIETIKSAPGTYEVPETFCIVPGNPSPQTGNICSTSFGQYTVADNYDQSTGLFTVHLTWTGGGGADATNNLDLNYKVYKPPVANSGPPGGPGGPGGNSGPEAWQAPVLVMCASDITTIPFSKISTSNICVPPYPDDGPLTINIPNGDTIGLTELVNVQEGSFDYTQAYNGTCSTAGSTYTNNNWNVASMEGLFGYTQFDASQIQWYDMVPGPATYKFTLTCSTPLYNGIAPVTITKTITVNVGP